MNTKINRDVPLRYRPFIRKTSFFVCSRDCMEARKKTQRIIRNGIRNAEWCAKKFHSSIPYSVFRCSVRTRTDSFIHTVVMKFTFVFPGRCRIKLLEKRRCTVENAGEYPLRFSSAHSGISRNNSNVSRNSHFLRTLSTSINQP